MARLKRCAGCGEDKPPACYNKRKIEADGLNKWCRECSIAYQRRFRLENPKLAWAMKARNNALARTKRKGHDPSSVTITKEYLLRALEAQDDRCYYCDEELNFGHTTQGCHPDSPTVDAVNPKRPYTNDNIVVSCARCNTIKSNADMGLLQRICDRMQSFYLHRAWGECMEDKSL